MENHPPKYRPISPERQRKCKFAGKRKVLDTASSPVLMFIIDFKLRGAYASRTSQ